MEKLQDLLFPIPQEFHKWYGFASPRGFFRGTTMREGWQFNMDFTSIDKPIMFSAIYLDGDWSKINRRILENGEEEFWYDGSGIRRCVYDRAKTCVYCGRCFSERMEEAMKKPKPEDAPQDEYLLPWYEMAKQPRTGKYDHYVHAYRPEHHDDARFLSPRAGFRGTDEMEDARLRYLYHIVQKECEVGDAPHMHHAVEEYLVFTGSDITNFFDFDAEIEIRLGYTPDTMETFTVKEPTVVRIPAGCWHGPVTFRRVGAPVNFMPFYPSGEYGRVVVQDGTYRYEGTDLPE